MEAAPRRLLLGACAVAVLMAIAVVANAGSGEVASVIGQAKCADCTTKNVNAEAAFNGLKVAIKCKNSNGEYERKAVGELQSSGAFSVPVSVNLADCVAQLHSAAGKPCPGQEPSRITPLSDGTFVAVPGNTQQASTSAVCASVTISGSVMKHFHEHIHKKEGKPEPSKPEPKPKPQPEQQPPSPTYESPPTTPIYHPPATHMHMADHFHKEDHELEHYFDHFHKKSVVAPKPKPEPKPQPEQQPPRPTYGSATPTNGGSPTPVSDHAPHMFDHYYKGHHHHHFFDYFHKKPVPPEPKPQPKPQPENQPPVPTFGSPPPVYYPPAAKH